MEKVALVTIPAALLVDRWTHVYVQVSMPATFETVTILGVPWLAKRGG